jgi:hypothetical protein
VESKRRETGFVHIVRGSRWLGGENTEGYDYELIANSKKEYSKTS